MNGGRRIAVVIPQRGQVELTEACVRGLRRWESPEIEIVVVDDGSPMECRVETRELELLGCRVVWRAATGVTASWNAGWRRSRGDIVVFLNNDVVVHGPFLEQLVAPLMEPGESKSDAAVGRARVAGVRWREERGVGRVLEGWCFATARETLCELGGFDERMRVYFSDTEYQRRVGERWGPGSLSVAEGVWPVEHLGHRTAHARSWQSERRVVWRADRAVFRERHLPCAAVITRECGSS